MKLYRLKRFSFARSFFRNYRRLAVAIVVAVIIAMGSFTSNKVLFNSGAEEVEQTNERKPEVLSVIEPEDDVDETPTPTTTQEVISNEVKENVILPTFTPTPPQNNGVSGYTPSSYNDSSNQNTPIPIPTNTVIVVEVTPTPLLPTPTPTPTPTPIPTIFISPEVEDALDELDQTLINIGNQSVPMSVIQGRKQQAYQNWVASHQDEYAVIISTHYINSLSAILVANGL